MAADNLSMDDDWERQTAADIERSYPHWLVMWGRYSRLFRGFPRFKAPKGTIISAADPQSLAFARRCVPSE